MDEGRPRQLADELRERPLDGREQLEEVREARDRVVARQELREDVAAADGAREDDALLAPPPPSAPGATRRVRTISKPVSSTSRSTWLVTVTGKASLPWWPFEPLPIRLR